MRECKKCKKELMKAIVFEEVKRKPAIYTCENKECDNYEIAMFNIID